MVKIWMLFLFVMLACFVFSGDFVFIETDSEVEPFYVSAVPVSQDLFERVMGYNRSFFRGGDLPVESISWYEALVFCNRLSIAHNLVPVYIFQGERDPDLWGDIPSHRVSVWTDIVADVEANGYRMLTHVEWYYLYERVREEIFSDLEAYAWVASNSYDRTHPIGSKRADSLELHDFMGNVMEWRYCHRGGLSERYFSRSESEGNLLYNNLSHSALRQSYFIRIRDDYNLLPLVRNRFIGLRIGRSI